MKNTPTGPHCGFILAPLCGNFFTLVNRKLPHSSKNYAGLLISTRSFPVLGELRSIWYVDGAPKKCIPNDIYNMLSPLSLAQKRVNSANYNILHTKRTYSTKANSDSTLIPVLSYSNADILKKTIIKDNKGKSGVYR